MNETTVFTDDDTLKIGVPFQKVNREKRLVSGFASMNNHDRQGDIVLPAANVDAFGRWSKNIREMHENKAVGKAVNVEERQWTNPDDGQTYDGIYVDVYVSKGAEDTWQKVLDGTLTGFSIGGNIREAEKAYDAKLDKSVRIVKKYDLSELSLVDVPANQFALIAGIQKNADGQEELVGAASVELENVFLDEVSGRAFTSKAEEFYAPEDPSRKTVKIGWVERDANYALEVAKMVKNYNRGKEEQQVAEEEKKVVAVVDPDEPKTAEEALGQPAAEDQKKVVAGGEVIEKAATMIQNENTQGQLDGTNGLPATTENHPLLNVNAVNGNLWFGELAQVVKNAVGQDLASAGLYSIVDIVNTMANSINSISNDNKTFLQKLADLEDKVNGLSKKSEDITASLGSVEKSMTEVVDSTALRKSGDTTVSTPKTNFWSGAVIGSVADVD